MMAIIICLVIILFGGIVVWLRRKYHPKYWDTHQVKGFTLEDVNTIKNAYLINNDEYQRLRRSILRNGMTLVELLVSISILVIIILLFSTILAKSQKLVSTSIKTLRSNAETISIVNVIRNDLFLISKQGFLCITETNSQPIIIFIKIARSESIYSPIQSNVSCISYGMVPNQALNANDNILWRQGWVMCDIKTYTSYLAGRNPIPIDVWNQDLAYIPK